MRGLIVVDDPLRDPLGPLLLQPGSLQPVANRPIAEHVLDMFAQAGVRDVVVAAARESTPAVRECLAPCETARTTRVRFVDQPGPVDLRDAIRLALPLLEDAPCILHVGNGLLDEPLGPLAARVADSPDLLVSLYRSPAPWTRLSPMTRELLPAPQLFGPRETVGVAGVLFAGPRTLRHLIGLHVQPGGELDLTAVAQGIAGLGGRLQPGSVRSWHRYAGDAGELLELNRVALDRLDPQTPDPHMRRMYGNQIDGRVQISDQASVRTSVIIGPAVIGPHAQISDSYIGPYTSIGPRARVEGAELERSIIAAGASVMHIGGRMVASVVGRDARIFREFSLPSGIRVRLGDGTEVALC